MMFLLHLHRCYLIRPELPNLHIQIMYIFLLKSQLLIQLHRGPYNHMKIIKTVLLQHIHIKCWMTSIVRDWYIIQLRTDIQMNLIVYLFIEKKSCCKALQKLLPSCVCELLASCMLDCKPKKVFASRLSGSSTCK